MLRCCSAATRRLVTFKNLFFQKIFSFSVNFFNGLHYRVRIEVNSSYCECKVVNHMKIVKHFSQGKLNSSKLYFSTLYPCFIHPLHTIIKRNIIHTRNYTTKYKKCSAILRKHFWPATR